MQTRTAILFAAAITLTTTGWAQAPASAAQATQPAAAARNQTPAASSAPQPSPSSGSQGSGAQTPSTSEQTPSAAVATTDTQTPVEPPGFTYNPEGRRDPFVSLMRRGATTRSGGSSAARPAGLAGLEVAEVTLRGTVRSREGYVAILQGADQKAYIVRAGDRLFDGTVRTISQNDMVILQQVNDPLSLEKQREVRKVLRQAEAN